MRIPVRIALWMCAIPLLADPSLRVSSPAAGVLTIEASDSDGLNELQILDRADDKQYRTQMSGAGPTKKFQRSFRIAELFPEVTHSTRELEVEVRVSNTRGQTQIVQATVRLQK